MPETDFQVEAIGEIYAQALVNEAQKQNALEQITTDVRGIGELLKTNQAFAAFAQALTIGEDERIAALRKIFEGRIHNLTLNVLISLARRDRFMFLNGLVEGFEQILRKMSGHVDVELISSSELKPEVVERVKQALAKNLGRTPDVKITVDPKLIGGVTLRIGDTLIDGSVATQLEKIREQLKSRGVSSLQGKLENVLA
jgi:F-type H+-transporting ATPase subunit delta